ncbi:MAG: tandem-95 repeat protein [Candidatus Thermoplasmatota archaeon]|nr:tandem-95 repeat protein [Candidatus Thermoplasmatota archaeon]
MVPLGRRLAPLIIAITVLTGSLLLIVPEGAPQQISMTITPLDDPELPPWGYHKGILPNPLPEEDIALTYRNASKFTQFVPVWGRPSTFYNLSTDLEGTWGDIFVDQLIRENGMFPLVHLNFYGENLTLIHPPSLPSSTLNSPAWRSLYLQSVKDVVNASRPAYISLGNEVNRWFEKYGNTSGDQNGFQHYVSLYHEAYDQVKLISPQTRVFCTFSREIVSENREADMSVLGLFDPDKLDLVVLTSYPFSVSGINRVSDMDDDYYSRVLQHTGPKPFGFSEISWSSHTAFGGQEEQANFIRNATSRLTLDQGVDLELIGWNWLHDLGPGDLTGLISREGVPKKGLEAWIDNAPPSYDRDRRKIELLEDFGIYEYDLEMTFFDPDPWDILGYEIWNGTGYSNTTNAGKVNAWISGDTLILTSVDNATGSVQLRIKVEDWSGDSNWTLILVNLTNVNDPPGLKRPFDELVFSEGGSPFYDLSYYLYDPDDELNTLTVVILEAPGLNISLDMATSPYMVVFTDQKEFNGQTHVLMNVSDPDGAWITVRIPVRVLPINDPPVLSAPAEIIFEEDTVKELDFSPWAEDDDDLELLWNFTIDGDARVLLEINGTILRMVPAENWFGSFMLKVNVSDGEDFDTGDVLVSVTPVNDPPIIGTPGPIFILEDEEYLFDLMQLSPFDPDGDRLYWYMHSASPLIDSVVIYDNYTIMVRPYLDGSGTGNFTLKVQDGRGGVAFVNFTVNIEAVNDAPYFIAPEEWTLDIGIGSSRTVDLRYIPYFVEDVDDQLTSLISLADHPFASVDGLVINISIPMDAPLGNFSILVHVTDPHGAVSEGHELTIVIVDQDENLGDLEIYNVTLSNQNGNVQVTVQGRTGQTIWVVFTGLSITMESHRMTESTREPGTYAVEITDPQWEDGTEILLHLSRSRGGPNESGDLPYMFIYSRGDNGPDDDDQILPYLIGIASLLLLVIVLGVVIVMRNRRGRTSELVNLTPPEE